MAEHFTESDSDSNLTFAKFQAMQHEIENKLAAFDADAYVRLGEDGFKGFRMLQRGAVVLVGGSDRPDSRGREIAAQIGGLAPEVTVRLTDMLPDGQIYLLDAQPHG